MIMISGYLEYAVAEREDVAAGLADVAARSRQDPGCIEYWWAEDVETPGRFRFFEYWASEDEFTANRDQPYEHEFMQRFVHERVQGVEAWSYAVTGRQAAVG